MPIKNHVSGIYMITNKINGKVYIGQSKSVTTRWRQHKYALIDNKHYNIHLQTAYNKYGIDSFEFSILEKCGNDIIDECEIYWIDYYKATDDNYGYNFESGGHKNKIISDITKLKIKDANTGKVLSEETKKKVSKANKGKILSTEHKEKLSKYWKGKTLFAGHKHSEESRKKISESKKGKKINKINKHVSFSKEHCNNISKGNTGRIVSEETRKRISEAKKGTKYKKERRNNYG